MGEGNGNPLQCSCLENPRDGGAWWAAIYGVAQSRTQLRDLAAAAAAAAAMFHIKKETLLCQQRSISSRLMAFPIIMYGCESWTIKKADAEELMLLNCGVGEDS